MSDKWLDKACNLDAQLQLQMARAEALQAERDRLREELKELRSDLPYIIGWNAGYDHAKAEAAALAMALEQIKHTFTEDSHGNMKSMDGSYYQKIANDALAKEAGE